MTDHTPPSDRTAPPADEAALVERLRQGDMRSYEALFRRYYPLYLAFCRGMVKDDALAQDVCQNVFLKLWLHRERLDPGQSLRNLVYVLCKREVIDYFRVSKASLYVSLSGAALDIADESATLPGGLASLQARVAVVLRRLPEKRREAFFLSRFRHLSNAEIAERMNISVRTVEKHVQLALRTFRKELGDTSDYLPSTLLAALLVGLLANRLFAP